MIPTYQEEPQLRNDPIPHRKAQPKILTVELKSTEHKAVLLIRRGGDVHIMCIYTSKKTPIYRTVHMDSCYVYSKLIRTVV